MLSKKLLKRAGIDFSPEKSGYNASRFLFTYDDDITTGKQLGRLMELIRTRDDVPTEFVKEVWSRLIQPGEAGGYNSSLSSDLFSLLKVIHRNPNLNINDFLDIYEESGCMPLDRSEKRYLESIAPLDGKEAVEEDVEEDEFLDD